MSKKGGTLLYGYNLAEERKFEVSLEQITEAINCEGLFSDDYFVYTTKKDRDFYFNMNTNGATKG